jgi:uncharacterized protein (TIGR03118 family)
MKKTSALVALCLFALASYTLRAAVNGYLVRNLVSDIPNLADHTDPNLVGAWGISESAASPFWIADAGSGLSTLYTTNGTAIPLVVHIPGADGSAPGIPTGTVFNGSTGFEVATGKPAAFLFDTLDGTISGWNSTVDRTHAVVKVDNSGIGASYTGLAMGTSGSITYLYAANFHSGKIEVYNSTFTPVSLLNAFQDSMLPAGYAPFNIQNLGGNLYVAYALQNASKSFAAGGPGTGYVDVFSPSGALMHRLISQGPLNSPWGLAIAPATFGAFANDLLVGNFGDGTVNAFNPATGAFQGAVNDVLGTPVVIPNLWALQVGNGGSGGDPNDVYFTAGIPGPDKGSHGLFGRLESAPQATTQTVVNGANSQGAIAPNTWIAITGINLAGTTRAWNNGDILNGSLPVVIDGVSVTINGAFAYVYYVSPTQINALTPATLAPGTAQLQLNDNGLFSATVAIQVQAVAPSFFTLSDGKHIQAFHADGSAVGTASPATPAKPGETITLNGNGFGQTNPPIPDGKWVTTPAPLITPPTVTVGGASATVVSSELTSAGLYQIVITVPATAADGDNAVIAQVGGQTSPVNAVIAVQH